ncbi:Uncharacterised protein [Lysinibacillus sphaericus]|nr:Uncharacterised protein [Lysinibacillus sphaericus]
MENSTQTKKMAYMSWQDFAFGFLGSALFVVLLIIFT